MSSLPKGYSRQSQSPVNMCDAADIGIATADRA
jgi:hypothetical protein